MIIHATFVNFASDPEVVELVHAWDEYTFDDNPTGYEDTKQEALASYGSEVLRSATVEINVPEAPILAALNPHVSLEGKIR